MFDLKMHVCEGHVVYITHSTTLKLYKHNILYSIGHCNFCTLELTSKAKIKKNMDSLLHSCRLRFLFLVMAVVGKAMAGGYYSTPVFRPTPWKLAYATFYGDETASETMGALLFEMWTFLFICFFLFFRIIYIYTILLAA